MDFVALLGTKGGPAIRTGAPMPTASLLSLGGAEAVIDCGLGVTRGLVDQGVALKDLSRVFITHLHSDHYLELGPLLHTAWTAGLKSPVTVWGPAGLAGYWQGFLASMQADIDLRIADEGRPDLRDLVRFRPITADAPIVSGGLNVTALPAIHPPLTECWSLSFRAAGRHVVFSGDTAHNPALVEFARGADLLIHEAMLAEGLAALAARVGNGDDRLLRHLQRSHTLAADAARVAAAAGVRALALHHLIPSDDPDFGAADWARAVAPHWTGPLHLGTDGLCLPLD
ncbi:MBL fold metallo-hydrolase [Pararhodobacter sp. SW119]|uniref:MBL fold metallo-hydrolase n=1 Tax=Pararhodobacter sp. SW119 TaxID=2780075 RepID=UPI001AE063A9|nr:MBL fold metallo-hydrolase [Pararhodobacter sp. SW119]